MTYLELIRLADRQLDNGNITIGEYEKMLEPLKQEIQSVQQEQKEITMEDVKAYCEPRNLVVLTKELFDKMNNIADKFYIYLYLQDKERR